MLVVGLTGSIGMGKSAVAAHMRVQGIPVFDADAEVHRLYQGPAAALIESAFPGTTSGGSVERVKLAQVLNSDPTGFMRLEAIVHPLVWRAEREFLHHHAHDGAKLAVLEIPLLFEAGSEAKMDAVIVVSASPHVQRQRVLERPGMTLPKLQILLARQMADEEKRQRADFIVDTNGSMTETTARTDAVLQALEGRPATAFHRFWT